MVASQHYDLAIDTNLGGENTSDYVIPSQKAVKTYVDEASSKILDYYGTCSTGASTRAKVVVCPDFVLKEGVSIRVRFTNAQSYNGAPTLNVNGTGAIDVVVRGTTSGMRYMWQSGEVVEFTYDGTNWIWGKGGTATTTYYGITKLATSATSTSTSLALTPASLNSFAQDMIAPYSIYSASDTYEVGDRRRYSFKAWECIVPITTPEAWTEAHWRAIDPIQTQLDNKQEILISGTNIVTINNQSLLGSGNINIEVGTVDQTYDPTSLNAQSGVAIAGAGFITGITSTDVTNALGYTPYDSSNPNGYTSNIGTVTSVNSISPVNGNVTLSASNVGALSDTTTINDLTTSAQQAALNSGATVTNIGQIATNTGNISTINGKIPSQASTTNQLADKSFVNSSIATNTANFIGTFNSVADLEAYSGTVTNNDYAFVISTDSAGNTVYNRYKYNGTSWIFEYALNNSSFTASQWASINSGITSSDVTLIGTALQPNDNISVLNNDAGFVTNTDYATSSVGGVIKASSTTATGVSTAGVLYGLVRTYADYTSGSSNMLIGKGTLENVLTGKGFISSASVSSLTDVALTSPVSGQVLGYDGTNWVNTNQTSVTIRDWSVS